MRLKKKFKIMKKLFLFSFFALVTAVVVRAQVSCDPPFPTINDAPTIYYDASQGTGGLKDCNCDIYIHTGVITNLSTGPGDWKHVNQQWGVIKPEWKLTKVSGNLFSFKYPKAIKDYYGLTATETVKQMSYVFRTGDGSKEGKGAGGVDMYYEVVDVNAGLKTLLQEPVNASVVTQIGQKIHILAHASKDAAITVTDNGVAIQSVPSSKKIEFDLSVATTGSHTVEIKATAGAETSSQKFVYIATPPITIANPPSGLDLGANYISSTEVTFKLAAPNKSSVFVVGDFTNWELSTDYLMSRSVDGKYWWLNVKNLEAGKNYTYQYIIDGSLKIADPLSSLVLDPSNDAGIDSKTYPNLPAYPTGKTTGIVSVIQPGKAAFNWTTTSYKRPAKTDLVIYETLVRDFVKEHNYQTIMDSLPYLKKLGITAIQLMPVNEFEGNNSWGYNPSFHGALDKYYGSEKAFKALIDKAHSMDIAIILDVVFNHAFGQCPLYQMYPVGANPYFNATATHDFNVGNDFNHEYEGTKEYMDVCLRRWLSEYKVDGFRFDLSKGFTQKVTLGNTGAWGAYDATRIAILKRMSTEVRKTDANAFIILEHFADGQEEKELSAANMMVWANINYDYAQNAMGYNDKNIQWVNYNNHGFTQPHAVGYMESHDEERMGYRTKTFGKVTGAYSTKELKIGLSRAELCSAFFLTAPGPKMLWQFEELGYDYSINTCEDGTTINNNCRLAKKPIRWDYVKDPNRKRLYNVMAALNDLRLTQDAFRTTDWYINDQGDFKMLYLKHSSMNVAVLGNFKLVKGALTPKFPNLGTWYDYFTGDSLVVTNVNQPVDLRAGEYRLYTTVKLAQPKVGYIKYLLPASEIVENQYDMQLFPNPASGVSNLAYSLPSTNDVQISIFNVTGQIITTVKNERQSAGDYTLELPNLSAGSYLVRVAIGGQVAVKRLMVVGE